MYYSVKILVDAYGAPSILGNKSYISLSGIDLDLVSVLIVVSGDIVVEFFVVTGLIPCDLDSLTVGDIPSLLILSMVNVEVEEISVLVILVEVGALENDIVEAYYFIILSILLKLTVEIEIIGSC